MGFDADTCAVLTAIEKQSPDISQGVTEGEGLHKEQGAGDQGLMFGYAVDETPNLMPAPIDYAHALASELAAVRKAKKVDFLRPDGKTQVTLEYEDDAPVRVDAIVVSTQHDEDVKYKHAPRGDRRAGHREGRSRRSSSTRTRSSTSTRRVASSSADRRATAASPAARSSSTPTAAWAATAAARSAARTRARSIAAPATTPATSRRTSSRRGVARRCEVQIAYAIGVAQPVGVHVDTFGTGKISDEKLEKYILEHFDMRPKALIEELGLLAPIYKATSAYGHFGRSEFSWEKTTRAAKIADDLLGGKPKGKALAHDERPRRGERQRRVEGEEEGQEEGQGARRGSLSLRA